MEEIAPNKVIRLSKSCIGEAEKSAVMGVLDREYLGMGAEVQEFEQRLTEYFGRPAVCVVNGTAALHLALQAAGIGMGDEVLVQSLTYVASFQAISATGAVPVACDVDPETMTISLEDAERRLTEKTKAIMPVHYSGGVGDLDEIYNFARRNKLRIIEDSAHAFGTRYKNKIIGGFGDIACFSFDGIKNITSGEGGCIVTDDVEVLNWIKDGRLLGVKKDSERRYLQERSWEFEVTSQGWRYHMSNIMAAIGIEQLKKSREFETKRKKLAVKYDEQLCRLDMLKRINHDYSEVVPHIYTIQLLTESPQEDRNKLREYLNINGIQTGIHYFPNHILEKFKAAYPLAKCESVYSSMLTLPLHVDMTEDDILFVTQNIWNWASESLGKHSTI